MKSFTRKIFILPPLGLCRLGWKTQLAPSSPEPRLAHLKLRC